MASNLRPAPRQTKNDGYPRPKYVCFSGVTINGTPGCSMAWHTQTSLFNIYTPSYVHDRQLSLYDILDIDASGKKENQMLLAFIPAAATTGIVLPKPVADNYIETKENAWVGFDPFEAAEEKVAAGQAPSSIPTLRSTKGLLVLKIRMEDQRDYAKVIECLQAAHIFVEKRTRPASTLFLSEKIRLVAPNWRKKEQADYFNSGILKGWKEEKY